MTLKVYEAANFEQRAAMLAALDRIYGMTCGSDNETIKMVNEIAHKAISEATKP